jgi:hypothetical protein
MSAGIVWDSAIFLINLWTNGFMEKTFDPGSGGLVSNVKFNLMLNI